MVVFTSLDVAYINQHLMFTGLSVSMVRLRLFIKVHATFSERIFVP